MRETTAEVYNQVSHLSNLVNISDNLEQQLATIENDNLPIQQTEPSQASFPNSYHKPEDDFCDQNPDFAIICSFIIQFGDKIDIQLDIEQLKASIEDQNNLDESLIDIHVKLLKKIRRYFVRDQWEKALIRYTSEYSYEDAYELEQLGYLKTRPSIKLELLRRLLDAQFECDQKFKAAVNLHDANDLRILPLGRDIKGNSYWQQNDKEGNFRIFQEQPLDYKSWKTICTKPEELNYLIEDLDKSKEDKIKAEPMTEPYNPYPEIFPELFIKQEENIIESIKVEEENLQQKKLNKQTKKNKGRAKKSAAISILKKADEEQKSSDKQNGGNGTFIVKVEHDDSDKKSMKDGQSLQSAESQVSSTLENLLVMVVSSLEYLVSPLSRSSNELKININEMKHEVVEESKPSRKRLSKREKFKREEVPRRTSSRIQQLQIKKIAEQEEEMKKMIETKSSSIQTFEPLDEDSKSRSSSSRRARKRSDSPKNDDTSSKKRRRGGQSWRRGKGKKKLAWDEDDSDLSSTSSKNDSNEDDFDDPDENFNYQTAAEEEDEFACEEEDTNIEPVIVKRARTARQNIGNQPGDLCITSVIEEDKPCGRCDKSNDPEWILLCDMCDDGYHTSCCLPPLMIVPDGDWFCPPCEHQMLLIKLRELYTSILNILETKERERIKRDKLRQNFIKKEADKNQQKQVLLKKRQRGLLNELSEPIAVQELDELLGESTGAESQESYKARNDNRVKKRNAKKTYVYDRIEHVRPRKTYLKRNISESEEEEEEEDDEGEESASEFDESSKSSGGFKPKTRRARASVSYRFQEYDELIQSAIRSDTIEEEADPLNQAMVMDDEEVDDGDQESSEAESAEDNRVYGKGKDMATIEALALQQEYGLSIPPQNDNLQISENQELREVVNTLKPKKTRKKARRLNDLDAASETEGASSDESFQASFGSEDEEEDDLTEVDSHDETDTSIDEIVKINYSRSKKSKSHKRKKRDRYESDDEYEPAPRRRRAAATRVSYAESTDDEEENFPVKKKSKKAVLSSDEESKASWKSSATDVSAPMDYPEVETAPQEELEEPSDQPRVVEDLQHVGQARQPEQPQRFEKPSESSHVELENSGQQAEDEQFNNNLSQARRDPIQELIQYCSESSKPTTMFNSFNKTITGTKLNNCAPIHPPFYPEEEPQSVSED